MIFLLDGHDAQAVVARLGARGIAIDTTFDWWATRPRPGLTVGFGLADTDQLTEAFRGIRVELARDSVGPVTRRGRPAASQPPVRA